MKKIINILIFSGLLYLTACGGAAAPAASNMENPPLATPPPADSANEPEQPAAESPIEQNMVNLSLENLSRKLNIDVEKIRVTKVTKVVWRDASLGCPKPGVDYLRVETPGFSITLEAEGKTYEFHTDESKRLTLCNSTQPKGTDLTPRWKSLT